ncbi:hypothetical protein D3C75_1006920 [compost metagenome]
MPSIVRNFKSNHRALGQSALDVQTFHARSFRFIVQLEPALHIHKPYSSSLGGDGWTAFKRTVQ